MARLIFSIVLLFSSLTFAYDSTWYKSDYWSGEYPAGFQVYKKGIVALGRTSVDAEEAPSVKCVLKRNRYSASKAVPKAEYVEVTKILAMTAKMDFSYPGYAEGAADSSFIDIKKGDLVEYLAYGAEGWFTARHNGVVFGADQDLLENLDYAKDENGWMSAQADQWVRLSCVNNVSAWFMLSDFYSSDKEGNQVWIDGVRGYFHNPY